MVAITLKQRSAEDVFRENKLFGHNRPLSVAIGSQRYTFNFVGESFQQPASHSIEFKVGDEESTERFWMQLHPSPVMDMFSKGLEDIRFNELPNDIALIAASVLLDDPMKFLAAKLGFEIQLASVNLGNSKNIPSEGMGWQKVSFTLTVTGSKELFLSGSWSAPKASMERFIRILEGIPLTPFASYDYLNLDVSVEVGKTRLSSNEYKQIASNDIILLDDPSTFLSKSVYCRLEGIGLQFIANFQENHLTVKSPMNPEETPPKPRAVPATPTSTADAHPTATTTAPSLENFDLDLVFQVGQARISIKELKSLKPGYTFDLAQPVSEAVSIVANGQVIGRGELLQIENHLGVRVIEFIQQ